MEEQLRQAIKQAIAAQYPDLIIPEITISRPEQEEHGDYTTNVAFLLAKQAKASPMAVAGQIFAALPTPAASFVEKQVFIEPGFINFMVRPNVLLAELDRIIEKQQNYGRPDDGTGQQILFEFGQPNTHKVPHIGHLFSYCYGESCSRILAHAGHQVTRVNYQGDVGLHVAKCLWDYQNKRQTANCKPQGLNLTEKIEFLQRCYQEGAQAYEDDAEAKQAIDQLNRLIYQRDPSIQPLWDETRTWSLSYYRQFEKRIGAHFDHYYLESEVAEPGKELVTKNIGKFFEQNEGAIIFRGEQYGLHTRVFINKFGNPTYEAKDVGLAAQKREDYLADRSIVTTASEQTPYWQVVKKAIELVFPDLVGKIEHIGFGMINLTTGKMSSRTGKIMTAFSLVETVKERVRDYLATNRDYPEMEKEDIAEMVAIGAIKYSFLRSNALKNISFDIENSVAFDGNSGPYLQYTYARTQSLLRKAESAEQEGTEKLSILDSKLNPEELAVLRWLARFPEVVAEAANQRAPHLVATYLFDLAQRYSFFYNQHQVISDNYKTTALRLAITEAVGHVLKSGLTLLGIPTPSKI